MSNILTLPEITQRKQVAKSRLFAIEQIDLTFTSTPTGSCAWPGVSGIASCTRLLLRGDNCCIVGATHIRPLVCSLAHFGDWTDGSWRRGGQRGATSTVVTSLHKTIGTQPRRLWLRQRAGSRTARCRQRCGSGWLDVNTPGMHKRRGLPVHRSSRRPSSSSSTVKWLRGSGR